MAETPNFNKEGVDLAKMSAGTEGRGYDGVKTQTKIDGIRTEEREVGRLENKLESMEKYGIKELISNLKSNLGIQEYNEILSSLYKKGITADNISFIGVRGPSFNVGGEIVWGLGSIGTTENVGMIKLMKHDFQNWKDLADYIKSSK